MASPMREPTKWLNVSLPQTLQIAVFLFYIDAAFSLIGSLIGGLGVIGLIMVALSVGCGWGIANERKKAWYVAVGLAAVPFVMAAFGYFSLGLVGLMVAIARLGVLVHPESRNHVRIWFK